jgi:hypothetical protein
MERIGTVETICRYPIKGMAGLGTGIVSKGQLIARKPLGGTHGDR